MLALTSVMRPSGLAAQVNAGMLSMGRIARTASARGDADAPAVTMIPTLSATAKNAAHATAGSPAAPASNAATSSEPANPAADAA